jgi:hypothetical protein
MPTLGKAEASGFYDACPMQSVGLCLAFAFVSPAQTPASLDHALVMLKTTHAMFDACVDSSRSAPTARFRNFGVVSYNVKSIASK